MPHLGHSWGIRGRGPGAGCRSGSLEIAFWGGWVVRGLVPLSWNCSPLELSPPFAPLATALVHVIAESIYCTFFYRTIGIVLVKVSALLKVSAIFMSLKLHWLCLIMPQQCLIQKQVHTSRMFPPVFLYSDAFFYLLSRTKRDLSCISASWERERFELSTCLCRSPAEEDGVKHLPSSWSPGPAPRALSPAAADRPVSAAAWERASCCRGGWTTVEAVGHELCSLGCARSVTRRSVLDGLSIKIHREGQKRHVRMSKALLLWYEVCLLE